MLSLPLLQITFCLQAVIRGRTTVMSYTSIRRNIVSNLFESTYAQGLGSSHLSTLGLVTTLEDDVQGRESDISCVSEYFLSFPAPLVRERHKKLVLYAHRVYSELSDDDGLLSALP